MIERLQRAVAGDMTHAWLFTGPPGSGRSNAAIAFAAALQCERGGCGECQSCHEVAVGSHPDVRVTRTEKLSIGVDEVRELVRSSALAPVGRRWQVMVVEDADRLTDQAANALLKAIEEPTERTVWLLCAPTVEDVLPTIRSRTRLVVLATPSVDDVTDFLVRAEGLGVETAAYAARASQGHIGRARALARDEDTRRRRREVVAIPARLSSLGACMSAAADLHDLAKEEADALTSEHDEREKVDLDRAYGVVERGRRPREYAPALRDMEKSQKTRAKRRHLDVVDRGLMDLISVYRDVLTLQLGARVRAGQRGAPRRRRRAGQRLDRRAEPGRIEAVFEAREQMLEFNVPPLLALESMMVALRVARLEPELTSSRCPPTLGRMSAPPPPPPPSRPRATTTAIVVAVALVWWSASSASGWPAGRRALLQGRDDGGGSPATASGAERDGQPARVPGGADAVLRAGPGVARRAARTSAPGSTVPLDYAEPDGKTIGLAVLRVPASSSVASGSDSSW